MPSAIQKNQDSSFIRGWMQHWIADNSLSPAKFKTQFKICPKAIQVFLLSCVTMCTFHRNFNVLP